MITIANLALAVAQLESLYWVQALLISAVGHHDQLYPENIVVVIISATALNAHPTKYEVGNGNRKLPTHSFPPCDSTQVPPF